MQRHILVTKTPLLDDRFDEAARKKIMRRNALGLAPYLVATLVALISPYITLAISAALAIFYALPATTSDPSSADSIGERS